MADMDKYFKELEEKKRREENNERVDIPEHCMMCSRKCDIKYPSCGRGVVFAAQYGLEVQVFRKG